MEIIATFALIYAWLALNPIFAILIYLCPIIIAALTLRSHRSLFILSIINILLGWSLIAWVIVFAWAFLGDKGKLTHDISENNNPMTEEQKLKFARAKEREASARANWSSSN